MNKLNGARYALDNANDFISESKYFIKNQKFGRALFFLICAIEETSKTDLYLMQYRGCEKYFYLDPRKNRKPRWIKVKNESIMDHQRKMGRFERFLYMCNLTKEYLGENRLKREKMIPIDEDSIPMVEDLFEKRNTGIYVDFKQGSWITPNNIRKETVENLMPLVVGYVNWMERQLLNPECDSLAQINAEITRIEYEDYDREYNRL